MNSVLVKNKSSVVGGGVTNRVTSSKYPQQKHSGAGNNLPQPNNANS